MSKIRDRDYTNSEFIYLLIEHIHNEKHRMMRGYSRDGREEYIDTLRSMMEDAPDEQTRQSMKRMIDSMQ